MERNSAAQGSKYSPFARFVRTTDKVLGSFESSITCASMIGITVIVLYNIVMRFFLQKPNLFGEEIACYLFVVCIFSSISIGVRGRSHMGITFIVDALPVKARKILHFIVDIMIFLTYVWMTIISYQYMVQAQQSGQLSTNLRFPIWIIVLLMAIGFTLCAIRAFMMFWNDYLVKDSPLEASKEEVML